MGCILIATATVVTIRNEVLDNPRNTVSGRVMGLVPRWNGSKVISYEYFVAGRRFKNSEPLREELLALNNPIEVTYMVGNPASSTIRYSNLRMTRNLGLALGSLTATVGGFLMAIVWRRSRYLEAKSNSSTSQEG